MSSVPGYRLKIGLAAVSGKDFNCSKPEARRNQSRSPPRIASRSTCWCVIMPGRNGTELARRLSAGQPDMNVLLSRATGTTPPTNLERRMPSGCGNRFPPPDLGRRVRKLTAQPGVRPLRPDHSTFTNRLPVFSPLKRPIKARGRFSNPSIMSSRLLSRPARYQLASSAPAAA